MRTSVDIIPNPTLKGLDSKFSPISTLQQGTVVKLTQNSNMIYTTYQPHPQSNGTAKKVELSSKLCELNNITEGSVQIEAVGAVPQCRKITLYVSSLDYNIINNRAQTLQQEFMNQVTIVWPNARIPLYYDKSNFVSLRVECQRLGRLVQNMQLQVLAEPDGKKQVQDDKNSLDKYKYVCNYVKILPITALKLGNINKIYIPRHHQIFDDKKLIQNHQKQQQNQKQQIKPETNVKTSDSKLTQQTQNTINSTLKNSQSLLQNQQRIKQQQIKKQIQKLDYATKQPKQQSIDAQKVKQNFEFQLEYKTKEINQKQFPTDTNILSIKDQISLIKDKASSNEASSKKNKRDGGKVLIQIEIINDVSQFQSKFDSIQLFTKKQPEPVPIDQQSIMQPIQAPNPTCIYLPAPLISFYQIDLNMNLCLHRTKKVDGYQQNCRKLDFLLGLNNFSVDVFVAQKDQNQVDGIRESFVDLLFTEFVAGTGRAKIYAKMPYVISVQTTVSSELKKNKQIRKSSKFCYININQDHKLIADPLTITFSSQTKKNSKHKQQVSVDENKKEKVQQNQSIKKQKQKKQQKWKQQQQKKTQELKNKLYSSINIINLFYEDQANSQYKTKFAVINKLDTQFSRKQKNMEIDKFNDRKNGLMMGASKSDQQIFKQLYKLCYEQQINKILKILQQNSIANPPDLMLPILITSFSNNGKSIMNNILRDHNHKTLYIDLAQMDDISHNLSDLSLYLELVFQLYPGAYIFFDNLDSVCYRVEAGDLHRKLERIAAKLIMRKIMQFMKVYHKYCIFTAKNQANIDEQFTQYHLIKLKNPIRQQRARILQQYHKIHIGTKNSQQGSNNREQDNSGNLRSIVRHDMRNKIQQIVSNSQSMSFGQFSKYVITGHKEESAVSNQAKNNFSKLAGIKQAKKTIRSVIQKPLKYGFVYKKLPVKLSRGILLYGASGTGKSAIGQSLADQFKMKFFSVKGSDILSKYIGGSEAAVRDVFQKAMTVSPSIVFFDQFQSIVPRRNSSNTGVTDRVVNQFLCYLDGVASVEGVYIVASSSRPELIDPALLRPGRIDTHIFLDFPTAQERQQLFFLYSKSIYFQTKMPQLVQLTQGYSYSDMIGLIKELRIKQSAKIIKNNPNLHEMKIDEKQFKFIDNQFLRETIKYYKISMTKQQKMREREKFLAFKRGDAPDISKQKTMLQ